VSIVTYLNNGINSGLRLLNPRKYHPFTIDDIPKIPNGTLLLCKGSFILRPFGKYTHVAFYYNGLVYQAKEITGVHTCPIGVFLSEYTTSYNQIDLYKIIGADLTLENVKANFAKYNYRPYEEDGDEFILAEIHMNDRDNEKTLFCSEFIAQFMMDLGIFKKDRLADNYRPDDCIDPQRLVPGVSIEDI
jgi:hypothetical protein